MTDQELSFTLTQISVERIRQRVLTATWPLATYFLDSRSMMHNHTSRMVFVVGRDIGRLRVIGKVRHLSSPSLC